MNATQDGPFDRPGLTEGAVRPLVAIVESSEDDALVAQTLRSAASLTIDNEGWKSLDEAIRARLDTRPAAGVVAAAALIPVVSVRSVVRSIAESDDQECAEAALRGLIEARDQESISSHIARVIALDGWQPVAGLPNDVLATTDLAAHGHAPDEDEPWWSVAHAKAGNLEPLQSLLKAIARDQAPPLFWGDPMYVASLLQAARPVPESVEQLLRSEHAAIDADEEWQRHSEVGILLSGLIGDSEVAR